MIVGQKKLVSMIDNAQLDVWPSTIVLYGDFGCGKHLLLNYISEKFGLATLELTEILNQETIENIYQKPEPTIYYLDSNKLSVKQQNMILKFIEEPSPTVFIILVAESTVGVLPTILNRCTKFTCAPYSEAQLKECEWMVRNPNELVYKICKTPGQLEDVDGDQIQALFALCDKIVSQVKKASYANTLTLVAKVNCDKDETKFDFYQFFNALEYVSLKKYIETKDVNLYKLYMYINKTKQSYLNKKIAKEAFMLNFLDGLWRLEH